uniref:Ribosomal protein S3 n=1 Tax=Dictyopteris divaricata TaxID=156996 RepID=A0A4Y5T7K4_9PHAE|nr:ribosomal protein S3 [Dictyopteris divaricata]QDB64126.1 ribosomal protein S3 [Dictyopteris divaricata]
MGQKTNPTALRPISDFYHGCPQWGVDQFNYITYQVKKLLRACCKNSEIYLNEVHLSLFHDFLLISCEFLNLHSEPNKKRRSRRFIENSITYRTKHSKKSWSTVLKRLYCAIRLIQTFTGQKRIKIRIKRIKMYTQSIPKRARQKTTFYTKGFNRSKFDYARSGMQLITLIMQNRATIDTLADFIRNNIRTRSRRRKHLDFLRFLKQGIEALETHKKIKGIKIQIKGRFGHKPKGRSKIWKMQLGPMPLGRFKASIKARYRQAQTKLGSVGIKTWIYIN